MVEKHEIIIIGGGPASISCSIQLIRSKMQILVISPDLGGCVKNAHLIENLPGYPGGISGSELACRMVKQFYKHPISYIKDKIKNIVLHTSSEHKFLLITELGKEYLCKIAIVASGTVPVKLGLKNEDELFHFNRLFYDFHQIPHSFYSQTFCIVGGGDVSYDYAINLAKRGAKIYLIQRSYDSKALVLLQERISKYPSISLIKGQSVEKLSSSNPDREVVVSLSSLNKNDSPFPSKRLLCDNLLVAIGRNPNVEFLPKSVKDTHSKDNLVKNLYFIGDVKNGPYRQVSIAMGDGVKLAMEIIKGLR